MGTLSPLTSLGATQVPDSTLLAFHSRLFSLLSPFHFGSPHLSLPIHSVTPALPHALVLGLTPLCSKASYLPQSERWAPAAMDLLFGRRKTPEELLRQNQRALNRAMRELDRERQKLETQEKKIIADIKKMAKQGQMVSSIWHSLGHRASAVACSDTGAAANWTG